MSYPRWLYKKTIQVLKEIYHRLKTGIVTILVILFGMLLPLLATIFGIAVIVSAEDLGIPYLYGILMLMYSIGAAICWFLIITYGMYEEDKALEEWDRRRRRWRQSP